MLCIVAIFACLLIVGNAAPSEDQLLAQLKSVDEVDLNNLENELMDALMFVMDDKDAEDTELLGDLFDSGVFKRSSDENVAALEGLAGPMHKRFTVDFNGMQVSYPQYLRLVRLQEKVVRLGQMIEALHSRYTPEQLDRLPQYHRLMQLHQSLLPLLPKTPTSQDETSGLVEDNTSPEKRAPFSVDFMGMRVSYPQYLRLTALQEKVIKLDQVLRRMRSLKSLEELEQIPQWNTLVSLHASLSKMLPPEYTSSYQEGVRAEPTGPQKRAVDFNGVRVSYPQYVRLMELQAKVVKLDTVMRKLAQSNNPEALAQSPKWKQLIAMRQSLQKLLPNDHPDFDFEAVGMEGSKKRTVEFNGVQVSYPQYLHLMSLQKKVLKLDAAMKKISAGRDEDELAKNPKWQTLLKLRQSLARLLPSNTTK